MAHKSESSAESQSMCVEGVVRCVEGWEMWCDGEMWKDRERRGSCG